MKNIDEYFEVILEHEDKRKEVVYYRKDKEKFTSDYKVIKAYSKNRKYLNMPWYGVVNKEFETIVPFSLCSKMTLIDNNLLIEQKSSTTKEKSLILFKIGDRFVSYVNKFLGSYEVVDNGVFLVKSNEEMGRVCLYNIYSGEVISNNFDKIDDFKTLEFNDVYGKYQIKTALATRLLKGGKAIKCYIDTNGDIVSNVYDTITNSYKFINKGYFPFFVKELESSLPTYDKEEEVQEKLEQSIYIKRR